MDEEPPYIERPLKKDNIEELVSEFYAGLVKLEKDDDLFDLINAANYMEIATLLDLACAKAATQMQNMSVVEARKYFNLENDFTPEEEAKIISEHKFVGQWILMCI